MESTMNSINVDVAGALGIGAGVVALVLIIWYVLQVIAIWKIFNKFGEPGWKAIIPVYNTYILYKATWNTKMFWVNIVLGVIASLGKIGEGTSMETAVFWISLIAIIAVAVISIMMANKMSKAFGHGIGFTLGLIFLDPIFKLILGFGSSRYIGNPATRSAE